MFNEVNVGQDVVFVIINLIFYGNSVGSFGNVICNVNGGFVVLCNFIMYGNGGVFFIFNIGNGLLDVVYFLFD